MKLTFVRIYVVFIALGDYLYRAWAMYIPAHWVRLLFIRRTLSKVGKGCFFAMGIETRKGKNIQVGNHSVINKRVLLDGRGGRLSIGSNVDIAQDVNIWTLSHDPHHDFHDTVGGDVTIHDHVWIASRATILPGVTLGRGAVVAAGSVVTRDVPPMAMVAGAPARVIGQRKSRLLYTLDHQPWFR